MTQQAKKRDPTAKGRRRVQADKATLRIDMALRRKGIWISPTLRQSRED